MLPDDYLPDEALESLSEAFWKAVAHDLQRGDEATRQWLDAPGFAFWARASFTRPPDLIRAWLLEMWRPRARAA